MITIYILTILTLLFGAWVFWFVLMDDHVPMEGIEGTAIDWDAAWNRETAAMDAADVEWEAPVYVDGEAIDRWNALESAYMARKKGM